MAPTGQLGLLILSPAHQSLQPMLQSLWQAHNEAAQPKAKVIRPRLVTRYSELETALKDPQVFWLVALVDFKGCGDQALQWIRLLLQLRPDIQRFILLKDAGDQAEIPWKDCEPFGLTRGFETSAVLELWQDYTETYFHLLESLGQMQDLNPDSSKMIEKDGRRFRIVSPLSFASGWPSPTSVYVSKDGQPQKLMHVQEAFDSHKMVALMQEGLREVWIEEATLEPHPKSNLASALVTQPGAFALERLGALGLSPEDQQHAKLFMEQARQALGRLQLDKLPEVKSLLANPNWLDREMAVALIASLLVQGNSAVHAPELVGVASLLRDIGMNTTDVDLDFRHPDQMTADQKLLFLAHPVMSANWLAKFPQIDPIVAQMAEQHHERRNRRGFPYRLGPGSFSILAEIIGLSEEFQSFLLKDVERATLQDIEARLYASFYPPLIQILKKRLPKWPLS